MSTEATIVRLQIGMIIGSLLTIGLFYLWTAWQPDKAQSQPIPERQPEFEQWKTKRASS